MRWLVVDTATSQAPTTLVAPSTSSSALSPVRLAVLLLLFLAALALVAILALAAARRVEARKAARMRRNRALAEIVGNGRWIHDSGSLEILLATDINRMQTNWYEVRGRIVALESDVAALSANTENIGLANDLNYLAQCLTNLRSAEDGYVTTKSRAGNNSAELTRISDETVSARRRQLQSAIEPIAAAMRT